MAFVPVPNTIEVQFRATLYGQDVENTFYAEALEAPSIELLESLTDALNDVWTTYWQPYLTTALVMREIYARDLSEQNAIQYSNTSLMGDTGAVTGDTLPNQATIAIARRSGRTGRSTRGRIFWMSLSDTQTTDNRITSAMATAIVTAVSKVDEAMLDLFLTPVIVSRRQNGVNLTTGVTYPIAGWGLVDTLIDSRKSRKPTS